MMQQKPLLGGSLALLATMTWGTLPLAAQQVLKALDAQTLVWARFVVAGAVLFVLLCARRRLPDWSRMNKRDWACVVMGFVGLSCNFVLFAQALNYISPTTDQVLWQLAPFTMIGCSVLLFKERINRFQIIGFVLLIVGLIGFFNDRFAEILQFNSYSLGILMGASASMIWVIYGIAQKFLLHVLSSQQILMLIYAGCALFLSPIVSPSELLALRGFPLVCLIYCCLNTLVGYGSYGEALNHWDASKVSVITTLIPIFTMLFSLLAHKLQPETFAPLNMNALSYAGAFVVVAGAILAAVGEKLFQKKSDKAA
ncbi:DMT family transporter [Kingella negevensis]|uniref:DMT family transporter n=1 Tax=Kingella negevensis TaxID=1522312 RepID=UPI001AE07706|nr:DMT family transporter [Kingella negevensis]MDK4688472.1 DMT family transporter [Kingella negevensis]WII92142.1 DMT family transporter [Kingella negevensis]